MTDARNPLGLSSSGTLAQLPNPTGELLGTTYNATDALPPPGRVYLCVATGNDTFAWRALDTGGAGVTGDPNSLLYEDPAGASAVTDPALVAAPVDAFARPQIWDHRLGGAGPVFRQGAWQADGDPSSSSGDGLVIYGPNALGLGPDPLEGGYARIKPRRLGIAQIIPGVNAGALYYAIRFDTDLVNGAAFLDDFAVQQFAVSRSTGAMQIGSPDPTHGGAGRLFVNQSGPLGGSTSPVQMSQLGPISSAIRLAQYGGSGTANVGFFRSRSTTIGVNGAGSHCLAGDSLMNLTASGVAGDDASVPLAAIFDAVIPAGGVFTQSISPNFRWQLAQSAINSRRVVWTMEGLTGDLISAGGLVRGSFGGQLVGLEPSIIIWRPGAVAPFPAGVVATWAGVMAILAGTAGPLSVVVDTSLGAADVPAGVWDMQSRVSFAWPSPQTTKPLLNVLDGGQLVNVAGLDGVELRANGATLAALAFTAGGPAGSSVLRLSSGALIDATAGAPALLTSVAGTGYTVILYLENASALGANAAECRDRDQLIVLLNGSSNVGVDVLTGSALASMTCLYDPSCLWSTQINDASGSWVRQRNAEGSIAGPIVYRPGATGAIPANVAVTWEQAIALFALTSGQVAISVDDSIISPALVPVGIWDLAGRGSVSSARGSSATFPAVLRLSDGAQLLNPAGFSGLVMQGGGLSGGSGVNPWRFTIDGQEITIDAGAQIQNIGDLPIFSQTGSQVYLVISGQGTTIPDNQILADSPGGASVNVFLPDVAYLGTNTLTGGAGNVAVTRNPAQSYTDQPGVTGGPVESVYGNPGASLVYREGATGVYPGNVAGNWARLLVLFRATSGPVSIAVDTNVSLPAIPVGIHDFENRATFVGVQSPLPILMIADGAQLLNVAGFKGPNLIVRGLQVASGVHSLGFTPGTAPTLRIEDGAAVQNISATVAMLQVGAGDVVTVVAQGSPGNIALDSSFADVPAAATLNVFLYDAADPSGWMSASALTGAGFVQVQADVSGQISPQGLFAGTFNTITLDGGIARGKVTLAAGTSGPLGVPGLKVSSVVAIELVTPHFGAGNLTRWFAALGADRTYGAGGTITIKALDVTGALQALDVSDLGYTVTL